MSFRWSIYAVFSCSLGFLAPGCSTPPPPGSEEEESIEAMTERTEMMKHRARLEPKVGIAIPVNNRFNTATIADGGVSGIKGAFEAVQKGMWLGVEFDYANIESNHPLTDPQQLVTNGANLKTEDLMKTFDRYEFLFVWEYDIPLGRNQPKAEASEWDFYSPIFRPGLGLGMLTVNPKESSGNVGPARREFDNLYTFLARPTLSLLFPFHQNFGLFAEADFDWSPQSQLTGTGPSQSGGRVNTDIGSNVQFSTLNFWLGITFEF